MCVIDWKSDAVLRVCRRSIFLLLVLGRGLLVLRRLLLIIWLLLSGWWLIVLWSLLLIRIRLCRSILVVLLLVLQRRSLILRLRRVNVKAPGVLLSSDYFLAEIFL